ncbi:MAG: hypothetical protein EOP10_14410 [Proteobacteria bacterium]|nr:MAG: hypothetical protein EOP10_14410 [Pseudomonadota bacterium]
MDDWSNMTCANETLAGGLNKNVCSKTVESKVITCTNIGGTFLDNGNAVPNAVTRFPQDFVILANGAYCDKNSNSQFDGDEWPKFNGDGASCDNGVTLVQGQLCSTISTATEEGKLAQLRCYAESNGNGSDEDELSSCRRDVRTNWAASTAAEFVVGGKSRPKGQFVFEKLKYDSQNSASLRQEETDFRGIQVGDSFTDCEIKSVFSFSVRKVDGSDDLYGEMVSTETNVSSKPACIAEYEATPPTKYMFKMKKKGS